MSLKITHGIKELVSRQHLSYETAEEVMDEIMTGKASHVQISAYLTALSLKVATITEITASAAGMRKHCVRLLHEADALEIVGTGGDAANTFNISTTASIIAAAAGAKVAKHGNRSTTGNCGSADVLEALGANINIPPEKSAESLKKIGFCFLYGQNYHVALEHVLPVKDDLPMHTIFDILAPLTNPAGAQMELMGVYDKDLVEPLARVLHNLGVKSAMVVHGEDGLDEISLCAPTFVCEIRNGWIRSYTIKPEQFGFARCNKSDLKGGTPQENAAILKSILNGVQGAKRNAAVLNAAAALYITGEYDSIEDAVFQVQNVIDKGYAAKKLEEYISWTIN